VIFFVIKAKNVVIAVAMTRLFNADNGKKDESKWIGYLFFIPYSDF
jgi:hypothetical protein